MELVGTVSAAHLSVWQTGELWMIVELVGTVSAAHLSVWQMGELWMIVALVGVLDAHWSLWQDLHRN